MAFNETMYHTISSLNPNGMRIGVATEKIAFFGGTPAVKKSTTSFAQVPAPTSSVATTTVNEVVIGNLRTRVNTLLTELIAKNFIGST